MIVEQLEGTEARLYELVAPLVMSPPILRQNNNYPYKTSRKHTWIVLSDDDGVKGFMPVERKLAGPYIDNYYVAGDLPEILEVLIDKALKAFADDLPLYAIAHMRHVESFQSKGFSVVKEWKLYAKMIYGADGKSEK